MADNFDVISYRAASSYPGDLTRPTAPFLTETGVALAANPPTIFGNPVALDPSTGHFRPIGSGDAAANIYGAVVRSFPTQSNAGGTTLSTLNPLIGQGVPDPNFPLTILKYGYIGVKVVGATAPAKGGAVYVQITAETGYAAGVIRADASSTPSNTITWAGAYFTGSVDSNGNSEIFVAH